MAHGHAHEAVLGYTLQQFRAYLRGAMAREKRELRQQLLVNSVGKEGLQRMLAALG